MCIWVFFPSSTGSNTFHTILAVIIITLLKTLLFAHFTPRIRFAIIPCTAIALTLLLVSSQFGAVYFGCQVLCVIIQGLCSTHHSHIGFYKSTLIKCGLYITGGLKYSNIICKFHILLSVSHLLLSLCRHYDVEGTCISGSTRVCQSIIFRLCALPDGCYSSRGHHILGCS